MPKVSVIVPCYNVTDFIHVCMASLEKQTIGMDNLEIILVDDCSTDNGATLEILKSYEQKYPENIMLIPLPENMKTGGARNIAMKYATGEYTLNLDADDWLVNEAIEKLYNIAKEHDCDIVEFDNIDVTDRGTVDYAIRTDSREDEFWTIDTVEERKAYLMSERSTLGCWNKLYRTSMLQDNNLTYVEHAFFDEPSFTYMVRFYEKRHYFLHEVLHYCLVRPGSVTKLAYEKKRFDNMKSHEKLIKDIINRNLFETYKEEVQYNFWFWYFHSTLLFAARNLSFYNNEEFVVIQKMTRLIVPDIGSNPYFKTRCSKLPILADLTNCDGSKLDMQELYEIYRELIEKVYDAKKEKPRTPGRPHHMPPEHYRPKN